MLGNGRNQWNESSPKLQLFLPVRHSDGNCPRAKRALVGYQQPLAVFTGEGSALVVLRGCESLAAAPCN